jgi:hypothetical protein
MPHPLLLLLITVSFIVTPRFEMLPRCHWPMLPPLRLRHYFAAIDFRRQAGHSASHC